MSHLPILPVLVPLAAAVLLLVLEAESLATRRAISLLALLALGAVSISLVSAASAGGVLVYRLGDWPAPYGIVLMVDRLSALMVALTAALAMAAFLAATSGTDTRGRHFHSLLQFQLMGLNGAFLTGDLFNQFVFFEVLLLASYALLLHGGGLERARAGIAYVVLNLCGSALFLIALGLLYGLLGTLNMADLGDALTKVPEADQAAVRVVGVLLASVFLLKAAILPLGFWLPQVYTAAALPVAALFVIMTKVGIYALLRLVTIGLAAVPFTADLLQPWLLWLALGTILIGCLGLLAAGSLGLIIANLVLVSGGTLLLGIAAPDAGTIAALIYYLVQTTLVTGAFFLLADALSRQRGESADRLSSGPRLASPAAIGAAYLALGLAAAGMPPLSGFLGKLMVLQSFQNAPVAPYVWAALLLSGFVAALVLARAASVYFWEPGAAGIATRPEAPAPPAPGLSAALLFMLVAVALVTLGAAPVSTYARATADQLLDRDAYVQPVLGAPAAIQRERRP